GVQRLESDVETDLVVALARTAVGHGPSLVLVGGIDHQLGDERPAQGGGQRVLAFVYGAGHEGGEDKIIDEHVAGINGHGIHGSRLEGFLANELDIFALAEVDSKGDDVEVVFLADPRHHDRGVQAAAVGKDDFVPTHDALAGGRNTDHAGGRGSGRHPFTPL